MKLTRRGALVSGGAVAVAGLGVSTVVMGGAFSVACGCAPDISAAVETIEAETGQRIGVSVLGAKVPFGYRETERFAMCSTFKWVLAAAVLEQVEQGRLKLSDRLSFTQADLVSHAPVVGANLDAGQLSIEALCEAIVTVSDNAAANLLLKHIGGPQAVTDFCRRQGDKETRLDRFETELNSNLPGDPRDTTTPKAMASLLLNMVEGHILTPAHRGRLEHWMEQSRTGRHMIRAVLPEHWRAGDKTGRGDNGAVNDVAFIRAPGKDPLSIAIYTEGGDLNSDQRNAIIATVAREVISVLG